MPDPFDMLVIGAGPAGYAAALEAARLGARTAVVEKDEVGGTCLNRGCIPTKALLASCKLYHDVQSLGPSFGVKVSGPVELDLAVVRARKEKVVGLQVKAIRRLLSARKVTLFEGAARLVGEGAAEMTGRDGERRGVRWKRLLLAPGSLPLSPPFLPLDEERILSSEGALGLTAPPERPVVVGGGVQGCEWAAAFALMGSKVTLVEALPSLLPGEDEEVSTLLLREMKKLGARVLLGAPIERVDLSGTLVKLRLAGGKETLEADRVVVSTGRRPATDGLGLEEAGVEIVRGGWVSVDPTLRTSIPSVWAAGDVVGPPLLAHAASAEGVRAARNALDEAIDMDYRAVPAAVFTTPEVGSVGLSEVEAARLGPVRVGRCRMRALGRAHADGRIEGFVKLIADEDGKLLGGRVVGSGAAEIVHVLSLAVRTGVGLDELSALPFAHPTFSEAVGEAALDATVRGKTPAAGKG